MTVLRYIVSLLSILSIMAPATATTVSSDDTLEKRDKIEGPTCVGGNSEGVWACVTVTFTDRYNLKIDLSVKDTKGDGHPVYVWLRVYDHRGFTDLRRLPNHSGVGQTVSQKQTWRNTRGRVTGFRAIAGVDDWGSDTQYKGKFIANPYP